MGLSPEVLKKIKLYILIYIGKIGLRFYSKMINTDTQVILSKNDNYLIKISSTWVYIEQYKGKMLS